MACKNYCPTPDPSVVRRAVYKSCSVKVEYTPMI